MDNRPRLVRRKNGKLYWVSDEGDFAPYIGGGAEPDPDPDDDHDDDPDDPDDDDPDDADTEKKFSQADVNRIVSRKERKLRKSIKREIEEELGLTLEEATSTIKKVQAGEKPDALAEVEQLRRVLDDREDELTKREIGFTVREKLQEAGIKPTRLKRAVRLVELDDDPDEEDIITAILELQDDMPELFEVEEDRKPDPDKRRRLPSSEPKAPRNRKPAAREDAFSEGAKMAQRFQSSTF